MSRPASKKEPSSSESRTNTSRSSSPSSSSQQQFIPPQPLNIPTTYHEQMNFGTTGSISSQSQSPTPLPPINQLQYGNPAVAQLQLGMQPQQWAPTTGDAQLQANLQGNLSAPMGLAPTYPWGYPNPSYYPFPNADATNVYGTMQLDSNSVSPEPVFPSWLPDQGFRPPFPPVPQQNDQPMDNSNTIYPPDDLVSILRGQGYSPSEWFAPRPAWAAPVESTLPGSTTSQPMELSIAGSPASAQPPAPGSSPKDEQPRQRTENVPNVPLESPNIEKSPQAQAGRRLGLVPPRPDGPRRGRRGRATDKWLKELAEIEDRTGEQLDPSERRKLQNRVAQRLARARSKMGNAESATRTMDLESEVAAQHDELDRFRALVISLQKENQQLKRQLLQQGSVTAQGQPEVASNRAANGEQGESTGHQYPDQQQIDAGGSAAFPSEVGSSAHPYLAGDGESARRSERGLPTRPQISSHPTASGSNVLNMRGGQDGPSSEDKNHREGQDGPLSDDVSSNPSRSRSLPGSSASESTSYVSEDLRQLERLLSDLRTADNYSGPASSSSDDQVSGDQREQVTGSGASSNRSSPGSEATSPRKEPGETPTSVSRAKEVDI